MKTRMITCALLLGTGTMVVAANPPAVSEQTAESKIAARAWKPRDAGLVMQPTQTDEEQIQRLPSQRQRPYLWDSVRPVLGPVNDPSVVLNQF